MGVGRLGGLGLVVLTVAAGPGTAHAAPVSGTRETVELTYTTGVPGAATGFSYTASFRNPADPGADPPPLRRLQIRAASGAALDTAVTTRCAASDAALRQGGAGACPAESRIGSGVARVKPAVLPIVDYRTTLFNADHDQRELLEGDPPTPSVVVHGYVRGGEIDSPIPTCLSGGYAPQDCPFDQVALVSNRLSVPPLVTGAGSGRRAYMTTPPACPPSRRWQTPVIFTYGDGVVEELVTEQPCRPSPGARPRLTIGLHVPRFRAARHLRTLRVAVRAGPGLRARGLRALLRPVDVHGHAGRVLGRTEHAPIVRGRRLVSLRLHRPGLRRGRYELAARARGIPRATRRFTIR